MYIIILIIITSDREQVEMLSVLQALFIILIAFQVGDVKIFFSQYA